MSPVPVVAGLFVTEGRDRIEPGGVEGGDDAGDDTEPGGEGDREDRGGRRELEEDRAAGSAGLIEGEDQEGAEGEADDAADEADERPTRRRARARPGRGCRRWRA